MGKVCKKHILRLLRKMVEICLNCEQVGMRGMFPPKFTFSFELGAISSSGEDFSPTPSRRISLNKLWFIDCYFHADHKYFHLTGSSS